jgi:hypothetical protein
MKGLAIKEKNAAALNTLDHMPHRPAPPTHSLSHTSTGLLPPVDTVNVGRRVSLAGGEAAMIETWAAKRAMQSRIQAAKPYPVQLSSARRSSIPYPPSVGAQTSMVHPPQSTTLSPKVSPSIRPIASALHLTAIRNNTRRASMPTAQLISSAPFTPPRIGNSLQRARELSPIKDEVDVPISYVTPAHNYLLTPSTSNSTDFEQFSAPQFDGPLPNPAFSFGSVPTTSPVYVQTPEENRLDAMLLAMRQGRVGSLASINTVTTDGGTDGSDFDWQLQPEGFDPDERRFSAYVHPVVVYPC